MTNVNTQKYLPLGLALLGLVLSPLIMRSLGLTPGTATDVVIYAMAALGLNLLVGQTGLTSFGHGAFLASVPTQQPYPKSTGSKGRSYYRFYSQSSFVRCSRHSLVP